MATSSPYSEDTGYVNIYGQDVRVYVCEKTGRLLIPIEELKNMGFRIYRKNQYSRLLIDDNQFVKEFDLFMLQSAQSYMLEHKIAFKEDDILESINKCKLKLTGQQGDTNSSDFIKTHVIEGSPDANLTITTMNLRQPSPATMENIKNQSKFRGFTQNKSPGSTVNSADFFEKRPQENRNNFKSERNNFVSRKSSSPQDLNDSFGQSTNSMNGQEKRNTENNKELVERLPTIQFNKTQHNVIITFIEKPNFAWVQDVDRVDTLLEIDNKVANEITGNEKKILPHNIIFNKIYLAREDGDWFRCKIIKFKPPTVFFVDYGNTAQVTELREASDELSKIPAQAARISYIDSQYKPKLHEAVTIKIKKRYENGTCAVEFITEEKEVSPQRIPPSPKVETPGTPTFFIRPQSLCKLKNDQIVKIIAHSGSKFAVQTKECFAKFREIEKALLEEDSRAKPVDKVEKGQLILYKQTNLHRAIVLNVKGSAIEIELLDSYQIVKTDISHLRHINESLAQQPLTFIWTPEFEMCDGAEEIIEELIKQKSRATVVLSDGHFDLKIGEELLSQKLKPQQLDRPLLKSFPVFKPTLGVGEYLLNVYYNKDELYFTDQDSLDENLQNIIMTELDDDDPYEPIVNEVCLGCYQGSWSRCVVISAINQTYEVRFIDFGNLESLESKELRKLSDDAKGPPVLAFRCQLTGLPNVGRNIEDLLKRHLCIGDSFKINIKKFNGVAYEIEIPSVYAQLS